MGTFTYPALVEVRKLARSIKDWLITKEFEVKVIGAGGAYNILKARKASTLRSIVGADRAIEVEIRHSEGQTVVEVRQGSWKTNIISNAVWALATGGMNLAISGWSLVIQKDLEAHIRTTLAYLGASGLQEGVELSEEVTQACPHCRKQFSRQYPPGKELSCSSCAARLRITSEGSVENRPEEIERAECQQCGRAVLAATARKYAGLCAVCAKHRS